MRIAIDARFYGTLGKGLGRYTQKLVEHLERVDHENDYLVLLRRENWLDYQPRNPRFTKVQADYQWYSLSEQILLPLLLRRLRVDLVHFTHFNVPLLCRSPFVVTIHDLILTKYPTERATTLGPLLYGIKHAAYTVIIRRAVHRARRVIAVSNYTKQDIVNYFKVPPDHVVVTYEGVDPLGNGVGDPAAALTRYGVREPYLLYVGNVYPHKNIEGLLKAFRQVIQQRAELQLVLVGKDDYFFRRLRQQVVDRGLTGKVVFTGFVADADLPFLYRRATLYVFPSLCEGFGLPALEACSCGTPVAASNSSCLPEVLGDAAVYFDPEDPPAIATQITRVLEDSQLARSLVARGYDRVKRFSWDDMAQATRKLYNIVY
ncbi:MAG: glycosyltransferase family 1 protein [Patescibacteria group bacterium]